MTRRGEKQTANVVIERLAQGGSGVARLPDGRVALVPRVAPGDEVEIEVDASTRTVRGRVLRLVHGGPGRVESRCALSDRCGCDWMHLDPAVQQSEHISILRSALERSLRGTGWGRELPPVHANPAPQSFGYRTRARLHVETDRNRVRVGYKAEGSRELVVPDDCAVLDPRLVRLLGELPQVLTGARGEGDIGIALGKGGLPVVSILFRGDLAAATYASIDAKTAAGDWAGARVLLEGMSAPSVLGEPRPRMMGADDLPLVIAAGSFAQASDEGARLLARRVAELARTKRAARVVELFAGSGTLSVGLAPETEAFSAVELDADAAACARENLALRPRAANAKVVVRDADAFPIPPRTEVVVLDPPRSGAPGATQAIASSSARVVVYVSCDVATLARDLGHLVAHGFSPEVVETFELFPQTSHVETVVRLVRDRSGRTPRSG